jgi:putative endonuclease
VIRDEGGVWFVALDDSFVHKIFMYKTGYVYILTNPAKKFLYVGVTSNLVQRIEQHKKKLYPNSYTAKLNIHLLIYFETYTFIGDAIKREKEIKGWVRRKKEALIKTKNPNWEPINLSPFGAFITAGYNPRLRASSFPPFVIISD